MAFYRVALARDILQRPVLRTTTYYCIHTLVARLPVNSSQGHLITWSCRHSVNSSPVNSSHTRLITQSTRNKRAHNKTTSTSRYYLHAVRRHPETVLNMDGIITAICVTLMYTADYRSRRSKITVFFSRTGF